MSWCSARPRRTPVSKPVFAPNSYTSTSLAPTGSDVAVCLFAIERPRGVSAADVQHLVVSDSDPYSSRRSGYPQYAQLDPVHRRKFDANSGAQVGADCAVKKVAQEQLITVRIGLWQRGQVPVQTYRIPIVVYAYDQCTAMGVHESRHSLRDDAL